MQRQALSVGEGIESQCTKCRALLNHTIVAMVEGKVVRVKCNTCGGEHNYRAIKVPATPVNRSKTPKVAAGTSRVATKEKKGDLAEWEEFVGKIDMDKSIPYDMNAKFKVMNVVSHPVFGVGIVRSVQDNKMDVLFHIGRKLLRCG